ncbi:hypothetical protein V8V91_27660 [Algoriphagus halophilus]|uniref:hypothetical protein n=1 Tax=Algoriphagus halophilus TaxID=226505 RepID=UPI0035902DF2
MIPKFDIEYGISISGNFEKDKKRQPDINPITIVRGDLADYGVVKTDSTGFFRATGLYFLKWIPFRSQLLMIGVRRMEAFILKKKPAPFFEGLSQD